MKSRDSIDYCKHNENEMVCKKCAAKREREYRANRKHEPWDHSYPWVAGEVDDE